MEVSEFVWLIEPSNESNFDNSFSFGLSRRLYNKYFYSYEFLKIFSINKAGYTANEVACGWAGAIFEVTRPFVYEQCGQRIKT